MENNNTANLFDRTYNAARACHRANDALRNYENSPRHSVVNSGCFMHERLTGEVARCAAELAAAKAAQGR